MPKSTPLADEVAKVAERVRRATKGKLNEQNTKASVIEPVLRARSLGCPDHFSAIRRRSVPVIAEPARRFAR